MSELDPKLREQIENIGLECADTPGEVGCCTRAAFRAATLAVEHERERLLSWVCADCGAPVKEHGWTIDGEPDGFDCVHDEKGERAWILCAEFEHARRSAEREKVER